MLFAGHSGTGSCPVFGVGEFRSLKNRSWRTALHARRKEKVFGKWIFGFQGSKEIGTAVLRDAKSKRSAPPHRGKNTLHYTRHFLAVYKRGKAFIYKLFTVCAVREYWREELSTLLGI